jgi:hypothetical protein
VAADPIGFSFEQQAAFIGYAFADPDLWNRYDAFGVTKEWFLDERLRTLFDYIADFRERYGRPPGADELVSHAVARFDPRARQATEIKLRLCAEAMAGLPADALLKRLNDWAEFEITKQLALDVKARHDRGDHDGIKTVIYETAGKLRRMEIAGGGVDGFKPASQRIVGERGRRLEAGKNKLRFGITYFDDALGGIYQSDLILATARSGAGKTQGASIVTETTVEDGKRVGVLALESVEGEYELRIKYRRLIQLWLASNKRDPLSKWPTWRAWFRGETWADELLSPWDAEVDDWYTKVYRDNLLTYYKLRSRFTAADLQREILGIYKDVNIIIVDHFHYVEMNESKTENQESNRLISMFRDLSLGLKIPLYVVVHINKAAEASLIPDQNDIMGSSEIYKKATTIISAAPAGSVTGTGGGVPDGYATYLRVAKDRIGGPVRQIGMGFFSTSTGRYLDKYALGYLNVGNTKWVGMKKGGHIPDWVNHSHLVEGVKAD